MKPELKTMLDSYNKSPSRYLNNLPDTTASANLLIDLLNIIKDDSILDNLSSHCFLSVQHIISSTHSVKDRINLISSIYLLEAGTTNITDYYKENYKTPSLTNTFGLNAHCALLDKLISRMAKYPEVFKQEWFLENITSLSKVITDCTKHREHLDKDNLAALMKLNYVLENTELNLLHAPESIKRYKKIQSALNKIGIYLYGANKKHVLNISRALDTMNNTNYWQAGIVNTKQPDTIDNILPTF